MTTNVYVFRGFRAQAFTTIESDVIVWIAATLGIDAASANRLWNSRDKREKRLILSANGREASIIRLSLRSITQHSVNRAIAEMESAIA